MIHPEVHPSIQTGMWGTYSEKLEGYQASHSLPLLSLCAQWSYGLRGQQSFLASAHQNLILLNSNQQ